MSTVQPTDKTLVNRAGVDYSAPADMSTVQDTDLLLINRAGVDYKCTFLDWKNSQKKAPDVGAVTLADVAGGARFTGTAFPVSATMTDDGLPVSTKKLKAYVEGALKTAVQVGPIAAVGTQTVSLPASSWKAVTGSLVNPTGAFNGKLSTTTAGGGNQATAASGSSAELNGTFNPPIPFASRITFVANIGGNGGTPDSRADIIITLTNGVSHNLKSNSAAYPGALPNFPGYTYTGSGAVASVRVVASNSFSCGLDGISVDGGPLLSDGMNVTKLTFNAGTDLTAFANGDAITEVGNGDNGKGAVREVSSDGLSLILSSVATGWDIGSAVKGPLKAAGPNVKLYCKLNAAGAVSDLQSVDPGFTAWTPAGTGPYTGTVTWPALLPSGNAPDADLPAGTTITVEVEASNTAGTDTATSNTITPA
jgi:hypothetical protein